MEKRFTALRVLAVLSRVVSWLVLVSGVLLSIGLLVGALLDALDALTTFGLPALTPLGGFVGFGVLLIVALLKFTLLQALADLLQLGIALEEHARAIRLWQERQGNMSTPPAPLYPTTNTFYAPPAYTPPPPPAGDLR